MVSNNLVITLDLDSLFINSLNYAFSLFFVKRQKQIIKSLVDFNHLLLYTLGIKITNY